jgi:hypothetical protein
MSKFIDAVKALATGREWRVFDPLSLKISRVDDPINQDLMVHSGREYLIGVRWEVAIKCKPEALSSAQANVMRQLREAVYGDLREHVLKLERALLEWDQRTMEKEIKALLEETFGA